MPGALPQIPENKEIVQKVGVEGKRARPKASWTPYNPFGSQDSPKSWFWDQFLSKAMLSRASGAPRPPFGLAGLARPDLAWLAWLGLACLAWPGLFLASSAAAAPSATTTTKGARSAPAPPEAALVVVVAEGAAVADDAKNKPGH